VTGCGGGAGAELCEAAGGLSENVAFSFASPEVEAFADTLA
jgi:hypothetical protein